MCFRELQLKNWACIKCCFELKVNKQLSVGEVSLLCPNDLEVTGDSKGVWVCMGDVVTDVCSMQASAIDVNRFAEVDVDMVCAASRYVSEECETSTARVCIH